MIVTVNKSIDILSWIYVCISCHVYIRVNIYFVLFVPDSVPFTSAVMNTTTAPTTKFKFLLEVTVINVTLSLDHYLFLYNYSVNKK